jgi:chaperonin GroES
MLKPLHENILVKLDEEAAERFSKGGLVIPGTVREGDLTEATVEAVGQGRLAENGTIVPLTVKAGDRVLFRKSSATKVSGDSNYILSEDNVLGIVS